MAESIFGTDGVRGTVGREPITPITVMKCGWAVGRVLAGAGMNNKVLIGKDTRISGSLLESALLAGISAAGQNIGLLGIIPTPGVAYLSRTVCANSGVMISASHNPYHDNGIKLFSNLGRKYEDDLEQAVDAAIQEDMSCVDSHLLGTVERFPEAKELYVEHCLSTIPRSLAPLGLKVVLDCANGACYEVAPRVLQLLGVDMVVIGNQPNGLNINANCGSTSMEQLRSRVLEEGAQLGIALDGDGDRVLLVDESGSTVNGDQILYLMAVHRQQKSTLRGGVVGTLMTNRGLQEVLAELDIPFQRTKVGDRFVIEGLLRHGWTLGGETSGHILCWDKTTTGDGIVCALEVLQIMLESGKPLSELLSGMPVYPQKMINISVEGVDTKLLLSHAHVQSALETAQVELGDQGRVMLRPSGTEPLVRVAVEGNDEVQVDRLVKMIAQEVESAKQVYPKVMEQYSAKSCNLD